MFTLPNSILRLITIAAIAGLATAVLVFGWMSTRPDSYRTTATLVTLSTIRTPQESIQYLADLDGALKAGPVLDRISETSGVPEDELRQGLAVTRIGSSSTVRLTYTSNSSDEDTAQLILSEAAIHANDHLNRARDEALQSANATAEQTLRSARSRLESSQAAFDDYVAANGARDLTRLAVNEERVAADLRLQLVSANAAIDSTTRESQRLRSVADANPTSTNLAAALASEELLIENQAVADALEIELELAEKSADTFSAQARIQEELRSDLDVARERVDDASVAAAEATFEYSSRRPSFEIESTGATFLQTQTSDVVRRSLIAGISVAALLGLAGLWWQTAVAPNNPVGGNNNGSSPASRGPGGFIELVAGPAQTPPPQPRQYRDRPQSTTRYRGPASGEPKRDG